MKRTFRITRHKTDVGRDVDEEIAFHLEMRVQELMDEGLDPIEAERAALAAFGELPEIRDACRRESTWVAWRRRATETRAALMSDLRLGLRQIGRRPGLSFVVLTTWALVIGANTAVFSLVHSILLRPLPFPEPDRLVTIVRGTPDDENSQISASLADFVELSDGVSAFDSVALHNQVSHGLGEPGHTQNVFSAFVTTTFFDVLGVRPLHGRTFRATDGEPGSGATVVISYDLWREHFGGATDVVGRELVLDKEPHEVIGVLDRGFLLGDWEARIWVPIQIRADATVEELRQTNGYDLVARLTAGRALAGAQAQVDTLDATRLETASAEVRRLWQDGGYRSEVLPLHEEQVREIRPALLLLWAGVLFVLVLGCVNIATLLLVRNTTRLRELATRMALGSGRGRVIRQLVTESVVLAALGGGMGLLLGTWSLRFLEAFEAYEIPRVDSVGLDTKAAFFVLGLTTVVGVVAGLVPALTVSRRELHQVLRSGNMPNSGGVRLERMRGGLVAAQIAVAFLLLVGAGLMSASLARLQAVDPGFETEGVLAGATILPWDRYSTMPARNQAVEDMLENLRGLGGVEEAAIASQLPLSGETNQVMLTVEGADRSVETSTPFITVVSPRYFATLDIPLLAGRAFTQDDSGASDPVLAIDEQLARRHFPDGDAIGRRLRLDESGPWWTVVGIVGSVVQNDVTSPETRGAVYLPFRDSGWTFFRIALRTSSVPGSLAPAVHQRLRSMNPDARFFWVQTMEGAAAERLIFHRLPFYLMSGFALLALILSTLGVYGVLSHSVHARTSELGLRKALGGTAWDLIRLTLLRGLRVIAFGIVLGAICAVGLTRFLSSQLYNVRPNDPWVFGAVTVALALVGLVACGLPAHRATRVDPVPALKGD
ncbi:MAG: ABC transporter permease [Thermoanaerobaculia bacterium]|nr:ABC transporter permease [Thermoanaerobaculia bacterium]